MKIIIAGAGAVGSHLARLLSKDNADIMVIDEDPTKTEALTDSGDYDLMTINGAPTSISVLKEAGVQHAALFIAVTPHESRNITCCMLAHALGADKTVARVDNAEYMQSQYQETFHSMGVDSLIYPEMLASKEIIEGLRHSWVRQYWEVHNGALIMMGIKLRETAQILNTPLMELCPPDSPYHIVAIKRNDDTIIPQGRDELLLGDIAYFMTTRKHINYIRQLVGKETYADVKRVMVLGGGRTTEHLIDDKPAWMSMCVLEQNEDRCRKLTEAMDDPDVMVVNGDGRDTDTMKDEGIRDCQAFVALAPESEKNILACLAAKRMGVRKTVAMVDATDYMTLAEKLDIGTIINKKTIAASHIYQMLLDADVANVKCLTLANADVAEFVATEGCIASEKPVRELNIPKGVALGGLVRDGIGMPISGATQIQQGDIVMVFAKGNLIKKVDSYFRRPASGLFGKIVDKLS